MNPLDSNVEPIGAGGGIQLQCHRQIRRGNSSVVTENFFAWLKEETIAITAEHFGIDSSKRGNCVNRLRTLARTA